MSNRNNLVIVATAIAFGAAGFLASRYLAGPSSAAGGARSSASIPAEAAASAVPIPQIGAPAPTIVLPGLDGTARSLEDAAWRGQWRLVNFWATWCAPCVHEMPLLDAYDAERADLVVIGIALDEPTAVGAFVERMGVTYPILLDTPGAADASVQLGNQRGVLPYSALVDPAGRLVAMRVGDFADRAELEAWLAEAPGEVPHRDAVE